ncbi:unnamed protein product [Dovyalis caffra]|uniref:peroxidase n=1 Tax=Dovyalis caffra TaxID=77055 RepID=A0AAV1RFS1_9ROSI|nr:unnamed protein product [Dovyalis caffra]
MGILVLNDHFAEELRHRLICPVGHCKFFSHRLYNFKGKDDADPSLNSTHDAFLKTKCQSLSDSVTTVAMDPGIALSFDNDYFKTLKLNQGRSSLMLHFLTEKGPANIVDEVLDSGKFFTEFSQSLKRMGAIGHNRFQNKICPRLEEISRNITWSRVKENPALPAKLLRLHYHDCFVRGCDASILLDSTSNNTAEKDALPNRSISGYDVIDEIKARVEEDCPETVSCADIVALAARDAVSFQFRDPLWHVFTGRKDGRVSLASEAERDLPSAGANFTTLKQQFESNELDIVDLVALSGAHTIGVGHCRIIARRLFNFTGKGDADPSIDSDYANFLKTQCSNLSTAVDMDPGSSFSFDSHYYEALNQNKSLFASDAALLTDLGAASITKIFFTHPSFFFAQFARSMVKMGSIGVLTGENGEVRKNCHLVN